MNAKAELAKWEIWKLKLELIALLKVIIKTKFLRQWHQC